MANKGQRPFACNNCDYTNGSNLSLITHIGVVHKMAIKYHFEVLNIKDRDWKVDTLEGPTAAERQANRLSYETHRKLIPSSSHTSAITSNLAAGLSAAAAAATSSTGAAASAASFPASSHPAITGNAASVGVKPRLSASGLQQPREPPKPRLEKCPVCGLDQAFPAVLFHLAQHHFSQLLAASRVPVEAPFKCPLCSNFAENYGGMLKHFLIFHQQLTPMAEQLSKPDQPFVPPLVRHTYFMS